MRARVEQAARRFFRANTELSSALGRLWPHSSYNPFHDYARLVAEELKRPDVTRVADIGAGLSLPYARRRDPEDGVYIIGVDISEEDMAANESLDERRVADVVAGPLPFADGELDLIVSSSVLEHLQDLEAFVVEAARVLRPGGGFIHVFPSRYASFAILNRLLPHALKRRLLYFAHPGTVGTQGFPAYYDRCYHSAFAGLLDRYGFEVDAARASYYGSAPYFSIVFPVYAVVLGLEVAAKLSGNRDLCTTLLVAAHKRHD